MSHKGWVVEYAVVVDGRWFGSSVSGLILVVPSVEIIVEQHYAPGGHSSDDAPLVIRHGHGADASVTAWVGEQLFEVVNSPD